MTSYLLDTCVLSEYIKKKPNREVIDWLDNISETKLFISTLTLGELQKGVIKQKDKNPTRHKKLSNWVITVEQRFSNRILNIDNNVIRTWANICGTSEAQGITLAAIDSLIAATAQYYNLKLVSRNTSDFSFYSELFNPWKI